jgi:hypothetical protein
MGAHAGGDRFLPLPMSKPGPLSACYSRSIASSKARMSTIVRKIRTRASVGMVIPPPSADAGGTAAVSFSDDGDGNAKSVSGTRFVTAGAALLG